MRWMLAVSFVLACGGSQREVSKVKYTRTDCSRQDCAIEGGPARYESPDAERGSPTSHVTKAPEPTCHMVGELFASLELGNYATPEERAPAVAAAERRCIAAEPKREDRQCF